MNTAIPPSRLLFATAMIALGVTGLVNADFALAWQQVPVQSLPGYVTVAYVCAAIELVAGAGLLHQTTLRMASRILFAYMILWVVLLKLPGVVLAPGHAGTWGNLGEIAIVTAGAWCLFAVHGHARNVGSVASAWCPGIRAARWILVVCLPMIGAEVIVDAARAGDAVMQPWLQSLPDPAAWASLTGVASIAASLGLLFGVWARLAATLEAAMLGAISVVYWGPDLSTGRTATTAFIISILITAGVWLTADTYRDVPWFATQPPLWRGPPAGPA